MADKKHSKVSPLASPDQGDRTGDTGDGVPAPTVHTPTAHTAVPRTATVNLPFVTAVFHAPEVRVPGLRMPDRADFDAAAHWFRDRVPQGKAALFYGGLAAVAVAGVIEWPVAAAVGLGTALAGQEHAGRDRAGQEHAGAAPPGE